MIEAQRQAPYVEDQGISFEPHFTSGFECILMRSKGPKLRFPRSMALDQIRDHMDLWNTMLAGSFPGVGYYAFSPEDEMMNPEYHVLVLFSNQSFYDGLMSSAERDSLLPSVVSILQTPLRNRNYHDSLVLLIDASVREPGR